ncbi:[protein-PII] uridylyltransferase [Corynebacterium gerontici]|uniref:Bifunctional uridylyltransferase/uridylyl-removing enzyme n=1 Tax=Corynebacterium gerontici TaxID=2079234 RepID=A0A3G6J0Z7_9CORY|nr:[protein-PII] uridylyltransferase [Corynebacterium gerontici]AZA11701.1 Bifunctional uridylyltransferase/uridylyl-removing enzyme [Corynebacterium gerontici]
MAPGERRKAVQAEALAVTEHIDVPAGCALAATGSLARAEMAVHSDLDLILLCPDGVSVPETLWYPIWESNFRADVAVRTPAECSEVAQQEVTAALGALDLVHLRGDQELTHHARQAVLQRWRVMLNRDLGRVVDSAIGRWRRSGSVVSMTRPDIKNGRGGLRDIQLIHALALGNVCNPARLEKEQALLLDVRTLLHHSSRRARDILDPEFAVDIAIELGFKDRYALATQLAHHARTIDAAVSQALRQASDLQPRRIVRARPRKPIDVDVVEVQGQIALARNAQVQDPWLALRVGAAAARTGLSIARSVWTQLQHAPAPPELWPKSASADLFTLLGSAAHSTAVIQELDQHGHWEALIPWWGHIRGMIPREPTHIHTVDRHCLEVVALCARQGVDVPRPDLLALAALFHDIAKGTDQPHEALGAQYVRAMATRLQLPSRDSQVVATLVAEHTTIFQLIAGRDPEDPQLARTLLERLHFDPLTLQLLHALVEADSQGTGPGVWTTMRAHAVASLVHNAKSMLSSISPSAPVLPYTQPLALIRSPESPNEARVQWTGEYLRAIVRLLALVAAKNWNIVASTVIVEEEKVRAQLEVRNNSGSTFDAAEFVQAYHSGVFSALPALAPGAVATAWQDDVLEVRTLDRRAALGALIGVLPEVRWIDQELRGTTMIARCKFMAGFDRAKVERDVTRVLSNGYHGYVQH